MWIGGLIGWLDRTLNRAEHAPTTRRLAGLIAASVIVLASGTLGYALQRVLGPTWLGIVMTGVAGSSLLAQRSLASHVKAVADALDSGGLEAGRRSVSMIVGRDPDQLDQTAVCRAAIESLAENFSDGVTAPALYLGLGGLAGGAAYKAANTADSMIGHRNDRYRDFGWAAARFDDLINLPASRLTAFLIVVAALFVSGADPRESWRAVWRDARKHRSPNAGWPEAAMAGALGLALAGPRSYGGIIVDDTYMGANGRRDANVADIRRALRLFWAADGLLIALVATAAACMVL